MGMKVSWWCRKVAFTHLNAHSSRSHAIIMLTIVKRRRHPGGSQATTPDEEKMKVGKLFIVVCLSTVSPYPNCKAATITNWT
jgi:hypothetical protein